MVNLPIAAIKDVGAVVLMRLLAGCGVRRQWESCCGLFCCGRRVAAAEAEQVPHRSRNSPGLPYSFLFGVSRRRKQVWDAF